MPTISQINASRTNGAQSKGPITAAGKQKTAFNATKHGLTAKFVVLTTEEKPHFDSMLASFLDTLKPDNEPQWHLVEDMATCTWKLRRCCAIQTERFELQMDLDRGWVEDNISDCGPITRMTITDDRHGKDPAVDRLRHYERQLSQQYARDYKQLRQMQADERKFEPVEAAQVPDPPQDTPQDTTEQNEPKPIPKVGRNELCPCGSNKKFKRCCLNGQSEPKEPTVPPEVETS